MRRLVILATIMLGLGASPAFAGSHTFQSGKLLDVSTDTRSNAQTTRTLAVFTVQIGDIVYTLDGGLVSLHAKDYARGFIVGDPIQASVEGDHVILLRPDGKNLKTTILKRTRAEPK